jgi:hypothetical protein
MSKDLGDGMDCSIEVMVEYPLIVRVMHDVFLNGDSCVHIDRMGSQLWQAHGLGHVYNPTLPRSRNWEHCEH